MKKLLLFSLPAFVLGLLFTIGTHKALKKTSENEYCASCHIHPQATTSWKKSIHYDTRSGVKIGCVECHLPPEGEGHFAAKVKTGARDVWSKWTKDPATLDWEAKSRLEQARKHVYNRSCEKCHETIFPANLSKEGEEAHLYYSQNAVEKDLHCINCHLNAGHYIEGYQHGSSGQFANKQPETKETYTTPTLVANFEPYTEQIPGSSVSFEMKAIPGGEFKMGSPADEPYRNADEGPVCKVSIKPFFMAEIEVTWDEFQEFYRQTAAEGRSTDTDGARSKETEEVDAIIGATPPYGQPDQNWGMGQRPAITMSYHAAETYCKWLSKVTNKNYRLPTEAEWEYACRAQTKTPYFFPGDPKDFHKKGFWSKFSDNDTSVINSFVIYQENSMEKTQLPTNVLPNSFGLKNMLGNVAEFCSDWYQADTYANYEGDVIADPSGPSHGTERVVRGGAFHDHAGNLRCATRFSSQTEAWLKTDPQVPKSKWWYSDCYHVGFRVVCEFDDLTGNK